MPSKGSSKGASGKGGNVKYVPWAPDKQEMNRRKQQSERDKAAAKRAKQPPNGSRSNGQIQASSKGGAKEKARRQAPAAMPPVISALVKKGVIDRIPSRIDQYSSVARVFLGHGDSGPGVQIPDGAIDVNPFVYFIPGYTLRHLYATDLSVNQKINAFNPTTVWNDQSLNEPDGSNKKIFGSPSQPGKTYVGVVTPIPDKIYGTTGRALYGELTVTLDCGPTASGYMIVRYVGSGSADGDPVINMSNTNKADTRQAFTHWYHIVPGIRKYVFRAPIEDRGSYMNMSPPAHGAATDQAGQITQCPFGTVTVQFLDVVYNKGMDRQPKATFASLVSIQSQLEPVDAHLSNKTSGGLTLIRAVDSLARSSGTDLQASYRAHVPTYITA